MHRQSVTYLLATNKDYDDILQFALHRFAAVEPSEAKYRPLQNFNVDDYIRKGGFGYAESEKPVELVRESRCIHAAWQLFAVIAVSAVPPSGLLYPTRDS